MTIHRLPRERIQVVLLSSARVPAVEDLDREVSPETRSQHSLRHVHDREIAPIEGNRPEVVAPTPLGRSPFSLLKSLLIGSNGLYASDICRRYIFSGGTSRARSSRLARKRSLSTSLGTSSIKPEAVVGSAHSLPAVWKVSRHRPTFGLLTLRTMSHTARQVGACVDQHQFSYARRKLWAASMSASCCKSSMILSCDVSM